MVFHLGNCIVLLLPYWSVLPSIIIGNHNDQYILKYQICTYYKLQSGVIDLFKNI